jgi:hypothetical protein
VLLLITISNTNIYTNNGNGILTIAIDMIMAAIMYNTFARTINNTNMNTNNGNGILTIAIDMIMDAIMYNTIARTINNTISNTIKIIIKK